MKVIGAFLIVWLTAACTAFAADSPVTDEAATDQTVVPVTETNAIPEAPGKIYTNSVKMELLQTSSFWVDKYEVTQSEFQTIMGYNPSAFGGARQPVENISWNDAVRFCAKLTASDYEQKLLPPGYSYTLPTEEEWTNLLGDATVENAITSLAGNNRERPSDVGTMPANNLGLYDIRGNVMEFIMSDPAQSFRILKGGSWRDFVDVNLRSEFRWYCAPDETKDTFGFRYILKAPLPVASQ
jgi:formylglycine-generating enzyme required for sulfatase activity